jgi:hypothetical protein
MHGRTPLSARPHSILPHHIPKRRQRGIQRRTSIPRHHRIARPIIPPMQFPAFLGLPASLPVRCPKNEALSNSTPVTAVTSFENRQVHRSSQVCTLVSSPIHSVQIGAAPQIAPGAAPMRNRSSAKLLARGGKVMTAHTLNHHLINAAPDLLAALKRLVGEAAVAARTLQADETDPLEIAIKKARAAIAKAEGKP